MPTADPVSRKHSPANSEAKRTYHKDHFDDLSVELALRKIIIDVDLIPGGHFAVLLLTFFFYIAASNPDGVGRLMTN